MVRYKWGKIMSFLALSYPKLNKIDFDRIQKIRAENDPNYNLIEPHFTLLFDVNGVSLPELSRHIKTIAKKTNMIDFICRCAMVMPGIVENNWYAFLLPNEGLGKISKLHDNFYSGFLAAEQRMDIPYIPHITVGRFDDPAPCKKLVDELNGSDFSIVGKIESVDIASYEKQKITTIEKIGLGQ